MKKLALKLFHIFQLFLFLNNYHPLAGTGLLSCFSSKGKGNRGKICVPRSQLECISAHILLTHEVKTEIYVEQVHSKLPRPSKWSVRRGIVREAHLEMLKISSEDLANSLGDREGHKCFEANKKLVEREDGRDLITIWPLFDAEGHLRIPERLRKLLDNQSQCISDFLTTQHGFENVLVHELPRGRARSGAEAMLKAYKLKGQKEPITLQWAWKNYAEMAQIMFEYYEKGRQREFDELDGCKQIFNPRHSITHGERICLHDILKNFNPDQLYLRRTVDRLEPHIFQEDEVVGEEEEEGLQSCRICFDEFVPNEKVLRSIPCKHLFHTRCILKWLHKNTTCPLCREKLKWEDEFEEIAEGSNPAQNDHIGPAQNAHPEIGRQQPESIHLQHPVPASSSSSEYFDLPEEFLIN